MTDFFVSRGVKFIQHKSNNRDDRDHDEVDEGANMRRRESIWTRLLLVSRGLGVNQPMSQKKQEYEETADTFLHKNLAAL
jgi:hypothetical protein